MKKRITKCYLVEVTDDNGKEICSDFCFGTKEDANKLYERLLLHNHGLNKSINLVNDMIIPLVDHYIEVNNIDKYDFPINIENYHKLMEFYIR